MWPHALLHSQAPAKKEESSEEEESDEEESDEEEAPAKPAAKAAKVRRHAIP